MALGSVGGFEPGKGLRTCALVDTGEERLLTYFLQLARIADEYRLTRTVSGCKFVTKS